MKKWLAVLSLIFALALAGCTHFAKEPDGKMFESCDDIYETHMKNGTVGSIQMVSEMVKRLGEDGYAAIDQDNQVDMEHAEQVKTFCRKVEEKQPAELTLIIVLNNGGFSELELNTEDGQVSVTATSWRREGQELIHLDFDTDQYQVSSWIYPDHGYLIFEKYYMPGLSGPYNHVAVRVEPLDGVCRDLNRKYILPVGYTGNNMFISDWNENYYGDLDFCDLFEIFYQQEHGEGIPYSEDSDGDIYRIPGSEFERIMKKYLPVDSRTLREKVTYSAAEHVYIFRPRGVYDNAGGGGIGPRPEVIDYEEREDGTMALLVSSVLEEMNRGSAFRHKVVIRPLSDGTCQYLSNEIIPSADNVTPDWYRSREENTEKRQKSF